MVNQIRRIYDPLNIKYSFGGMGRFDYKKLMALPNRNKNEQAIERYKETVRNLEFHNDNYNNNGLSNYEAVYEDAKRYIIGEDDKDDVIDSIIVEIFRDSKTYLKKAFWKMFGDDIYLNILRNTTVV